MSYAGTYGSDETCEHDSYYRSCWRCNGDVERFAREWPRHRRHVEFTEQTPPIQSRVVFDIDCPSCDWRRRGLDSQEAARAAFAEHHEATRKTLTAWDAAHDMHAELRARGLYEAAAP